ncbi:MAG: cell wall hydrolase [Clostridia bacterium]|nr:cell wall hydrolase [Clostridia bacterium]
MKNKYAACIFFVLILMFAITIYAQTKKAESSVSTTKASGDNMVELLARLINGEARGEPYIGQVAVGAVIMNRVKDPSFPNTIAGVIYQKGQFSCVTDGQFDVAIDENSTVYKAAEDAMNGVDPTNGALYFYNPSKTKSKWLFSLKTVTTIGKHVFAMEE